MALLKVLLKHSLDERLLRQSVCPESVDLTRLSFLCAAIMTLTAASARLARDEQSTCKNDVTGWQTPACMHGTLG